MVLKAGETFNYFGKTYTYQGESSNPDYISVTDENGHGMSIPKDSLMRTSLWSFEPDPEVLAAYDKKAKEAHAECVTARENAAEAQNKVNSLKRESINFAEQMLAFLRDCGFINKTQLETDEQKATYAAMQEQYSSATGSLNGARDDMYAYNMDATAASNRERGAYLDKFMYLT